VTEPSLPELEAERDRLYAQLDQVLVVAAAAGQVDRRAEDIAE
jgi:hypothetical protein